MSDFWSQDRVYSLFIPNEFRKRVPVDRVGPEVFGEHFSIYFNPSRDRELLSGATIDDAPFVLEGVYGQGTETDCLYVTSW